MTKHRADFLPAVEPSWLPESAVLYLIHIEAGWSIRALARALNRHPSTILRQIRKWEGLRDDPLIDGLFQKLRVKRQGSVMKDEEGRKTVTIMLNGQDTELSNAQDAHMMDREGVRILRRLTETSALLAVARDMDTAVVVRTDADGGSVRTASVPQPVAEMMAAREWISSEDPTKRIARYAITAAGRAALQELTAESENAALRGMAEAPARFSHAKAALVEDDGVLRQSRVNMAESPLMNLSRRRDRDGSMFLTPDLVRVGERLREDFELAQLDETGARTFDELLAASLAPKAKMRVANNNPAKEARHRLIDALSDLGPGLADVALMCCCFLEGLEVTEQRMGWAARSGKVVLRIALQRLVRHYTDQGLFSPRIG